VLAGAGEASFDVALIGPGQQFQDFELFAKEGSSHWTLTGVNAGIDNFTVTGGLLTVDGSLPNAVFAVTGGTLGGTGIVGPTTVMAGGILAPGDSIGTFTVNGAFTLDAGAIFEVEANALGQADKVIVTGTVNLSGAVLREPIVERRHLIEEDGRADPAIHLSSDCDLACWPRTATTSRAPNMTAAPATTWC